MRDDSWLERFLFRLEAQYACLNWAFENIAGKSGSVFELGLGHGRTYDHLRKHLPTRDIYVFDREIDCFPDCVPDPAHMILGELADTLPRAADRFRNSVEFVHCDVGSYSPENNAQLSKLVSRHLAPCLAAGALVLSDHALEIPGATPLPLPAGAPAGRYHMVRYRHPA
ncbi:hypothetical protein BH10PSE7_BH10PSE7_36390 [soil metagenome]